YKKLVANMHNMLIAANENRLMDFVSHNVNVYTLENGKVLFENHPEVRSYAYIQMGKQDPVLMIRRLSEFANDSFAEDIITDAARIVPSEVFNYASSTNPPLRGAVRRSHDPLVLTIVEIADKSRSPLKALPFLSEIYSGHKTIAQI